MRLSVLDPNVHQELILLLYTETLPYTKSHPSGITVAKLEEECKKLDIKFIWRRKYWKDDDVCMNSIFVHIGQQDKKVVFFTKYLRHAFAHCQISEDNGIIHAFCKYKDEFTGKCNGRKIFELRISGKKLIDLLTFIRDNKS